MSTITVDPLEKLIRDCGEGWLIDFYSPRKEAIPRLREKLAQADAAARNRLGGNAPELTPDNLIVTYAKNPHKVQAFLQVIGSIGTPDLLVMVWRILQGMGIDKIRMNYDANGPFHLKITLSSPYDGGAYEEYESKDIDDAVVLRHLSTQKMGDQGVFDGFYALKL